MRCLQSSVIIGSLPRRVSASLAPSTILFIRAAHQSPSLTKEEKNITMGSSFEYSMPDMNASTMKTGN